MNRRSKPAHLSSTQWSLNARAQSEARRVGGPARSISFLAGYELGWADGHQDAIRAQIGATAVDDMSLEEALIEDPAFWCGLIEQGVEPRMPFLDLGFDCGSESYLYSIIYWSKHERWGLMFMADSLHEPEAQKLARVVARNLSRQVGVIVRAFRTSDHWQYLAQPIFD